MQHHPAGELLVDGLLGVAGQADGVGGLHEVGRRVVLPEQPRHPDREEIRLARIGEVDRADPAAVLLEHDARVLERAPRLALTQEGAIQIAVISLRDLGVGDQVVEEVREEARLPYQTRLLEQGDQDKPDYRALQPFGQVPILEEDGFVLFESGAIVLYIGERSEALLPKDVGARARATQWLIAALNSIEPFVLNVALIDLFYANEEWAKLRRPGAVEFVQKRLSALSKSLGDKPYLDGDRFTAGDLMMTTVLRILKHTDIVTSDKRLAAYIERCTARPAFKRAIEAQIGDFKDAA